MAHRLICLSMLVCMVNLTAAQTGGVPAAVLQKLKTGVNITRWFCYQPKYDAKQLGGYLLDADLAALKKLKVSFVRLCLSPESIYDAGVPRTSSLKFVDAAVDRLGKAGLVVLLDLHDNGQLKLDSTGDHRAFTAFWKAMATHWKGKRLNSVIFEPVNEPQFHKNPNSWFGLQADTIRAIRAVDPRRTILATGALWGGIDGLLQLKPLAEKNVIYSFHCYDPFFFTHQGATWAGDTAQALSSMPFPSSPELVEPTLKTNPSNVRELITDYGRQRYDEAYLRGRLLEAVNWGRKNSAPVLLGEFGVYPKVCPPESRARWFSSMKKIIAELAIPNAIWGYDDALGLGRRIEPDGTLWLDPVVVKSFFGR